MYGDITAPPLEQPGYWREYFTALDKDPLSLSIWRNVFDDTELSEFITAPSETLEEASQRHQRKLTAMLEALEELQLPEQEWLVTRLRRELKLQSL
ncbi:hypothetical protein F3I16_04040 [Pseudomonas sp. L-22-4S-12]|uniref:hypothetical protein n=1 Tax=Pseudomonas sp. L-22-4S-12 TaxID=2610893 RepID=UPI00132A3926|nr:hypothetical protein [Pseudomonas sp. L-22-4S-12]MWV15210.1 hypothetical protein [Pseudomonas sp. L-22-4S-12]